MASRFAASLAARLRTATASLTQRLEGKELMGRDAKGNLYYVDSSQTTATRCNTARSVEREAMQSLPSA